MRRYVPFLRSPAMVPVVRLQGLIAQGPRGVLSDQALAPAIERAFGRGKPAAVALQINCPGGSPVQSALIAARIRRLSEQKNIPVLAFVEDVAASGGYWLAAAADDIYADACSVIGSIGVISTGFGLHDFISRHGIERRVHTAGRSKSQLDPFRPENPDDVIRLKALLGDIHAAFIAYVKARRGSKLEQDTDLFDGAFWLGGQAHKLGLIDGIGHLKPVLQERFGDKVKLMPLGPKRPWLARFGSEIASEAAHVLEDRAAFARYGV